MALQNTRCGTKLIFEFEVLAVVIINITAFYNIRLFSPVEIHRNFEDTISIFRIEN
jgi:hypothetical protein